jgi:hypothetical protein
MDIETGSEALQTSCVRVGTACKLVVAYSTLEAVTVRERGMREGGRTRGRDGGRTGERKERGRGSENTVHLKTCVLKTCPSHAFASSTQMNEDEDTDYQHKCCLKTGLENRARAKWQDRATVREEGRKRHLSPRVYASAFLICTCKSLLQVLEVREMKRRSAHASM